MIEKLEFEKLQLLALVLKISRINEKEHRNGKTELSVNDIVLGFVLMHL